MWFTCRCLSLQVISTCPVLHFSPYPLLTSHSHTFTTITSSPSTTTTWLTSTTHQLHSHSSPPHPSLSILLSALSVRAVHTDQQVLSPLFNAFTALATAQPNTVRISTVGYCVLACWLLFELHQLYMYIHGKSSAYHYEDLQLSTCTLPTCTCPYFIYMYISLVHFSLHLLYPNLFLH